MNQAVIKWGRFTLRLILLFIALITLILSIGFFYSFHVLTVEQAADLLNVFSSQPVLSIAIGIGVVLFVLSLLGLVLLLQYPLWRYPFSIFLGYVVGCFICYHFYQMHPFEETILQLNNNAWYYPFIAATALLLRAVVGFKMPKFKFKWPLMSNE